MFPSRPMAFPSAPAHALLVDRDVDTRSMYAQFLRFANYEVDEAEDGREALALAIAHPPHVVITETRLPGINGFDLCEILRADPATRAVPIVFVTGDAYAADVAHAQGAGADTVLTKPCLPDTLLTEIRRLAGQSAELRERARLLRARVREEIERSDRLLDRSLQHQRRLTQSRAFARCQTTTPDVPPPELICPQCSSHLHYEYSQRGGVSAKYAEQWDYYVCTNHCGAFQYRHRTRRLKLVS